MLTVDAVPKVGILDTGRSAANPLVQHMQNVVIGGLTEYEYTTLAQQCPDQSFHLSSGPLVIVPNEAIRLRQELEVAKRNCAQLYEAICGYRKRAEAAETERFDVQLRLMDFEKECNVEVRQLIAEKNALHMRLLTAEKCLAEREASLHSALRRCVTVFVLCLGLSVPALADPGPTTYPVVLTGDEYQVLLNTLAMRDPLVKMLIDKQNEATIKARQAEAPKP